MSSDDSQATSPDKEAVDSTVEATAETPLPPPSSPLPEMVVFAKYIKLKTKPGPTLDGMTPHILSRKGDSNVPVHIYNETQRCAHYRPWSQQLISPRCSPCLSAALTSQF